MIGFFPIPEANVIKSNMIFSSTYQEIFAPTVNMFALG
jgi:hypothetical protein